MSVDDVKILRGAWSKKVKIKLYRIPIMPLGGQEKGLKIIAS